MPPASLGRLRDHCLIIVGDGGEAEEVLAQRRWAAGGRLVHFLVPDEQVPGAVCLKKSVWGLSDNDI